MNPVGISLGWSCNSAIHGVDNGIRKRKADGYMTCPFDEMITNYKGIIDCLNDDFQYFYDESYINIIQVNENEQSIENTKYNFIYNHESPGHADLYIKEEWPEGINHFINNNYLHFKKRYLDRINNFRNYLRDPNNYIRFILTSWMKTHDDIFDLKQAIEKHYPELKYEIIIINDPQGKEHYIRHMKAMKFTEDDYEIKRLL
jgi:hypothetical protein